MYVFQVGLQDYILCVSTPTAAEVEKPQSNTLQEYSLNGSIIMPKVMEYILLNRGIFTMMGGKMFQTTQLKKAMNTFHSKQKKWYIKQTRQHLPRNVAYTNCCVWRAHMCAQDVNDKKDAKLFPHRMTCTWEVCNIKSVTSGRDVNSMSVPYHVYLSKTWRLKEATKDMY